MFLNRQTITNDTIDIDNKINNIYETYLLYKQQTKTRTYEMRISNLKGVKTCPGSETIKCNIDCSTN